uniref:Uncharacterized protein n=1 Tax=Arundo donax TaxID=35708 RepID=A0A0A9CGN3_ARUDO
MPWLRLQFQNLALNTKCWR